MDPIKQFQIETTERIQKQGKNTRLQETKDAFVVESIKSGYSYNFTWMGRPIIQYPQDMIGMQEIIWRLKPDLIIETGIAHGGSLIFYASLLELIGHGEVVGVDIDIREHNRKEIESHPMHKRITLIQGSSTDEAIVSEVRQKAEGKNTVLVLLDSNHTHEHVLNELKAYAPMVTYNSYCVVFDTVVEDLPSDIYNNRPWDLGNNPKTAVREYLKQNDDFVIDTQMNSQLLISVAPDGYLKKIK